MIKKIAFSGIALLLLSTTSTNLSAGINVPVSVPSISGATLPQALLANLLGPGMSQIQSLGVDGVKNLISSSPEIQALISAGGEAAQVINQVVNLASNALNVINDLNNLKNSLLSAPQDIANQFLSQIDGMVANLTNQIFNLGTFDLSNVLDSFNMDSLKNIADLFSGDFSGIEDMISQISGIPGLADIAGISDALGALTGSTSAAQDAAGASGGASALVADINRAYPNERKYIKKLSEKVQSVYDSQWEATQIAKSSLENQENNEGSMMTSQEQTGLLSKQVANYTRMEIQRSEAVMLQTKELIFELWSLSSQISKEEIEESFLKK